ncbi:MAG: hypothetical protein ACLQPD_04435 [Desulfomonilaceae bacterium]
MGYMSELAAFEPDDEVEGQAYLEREKEREASFWEVECEPCPIDQKEKELLVKEKCARAAEELRAKKGNASR